MNQALVGVRRRADIGLPARAGAAYGVKTIALALMALVAAVLVRRVRLLPPWLGWTAVLLAAALIASGVGHLLLNSALATGAWALLPVLVFWICAVGVVLGRTSPSGRREVRG